MKRFIVAVCAALALAGAAAAQNVPNYTDQGGATTHVKGVLAIESGGVLNVKTGAQLQLNGVDVTGATNTGGVAGVAAGYKLARGETALDGSNPTPVTTGLTAIVACTVSIKSTAAPGVSTSVVTYGTSSGTMNMYGWKVTSNADPTLVASTGTDTIGWVCVGT